MTHHPVETHGRASLPLFCHTYMLMLRSRRFFLTPKGCDDCRTHDDAIRIERRRRDMLRQAKNMPRLRRSFVLLASSFYKHVTPSALKNNELCNMSYIRR